MRSLVLSPCLGSYTDLVHGGGKDRSLSVHDALDGGTRKAGTLCQFILGPALAVKYGGNLLLWGHGAKVRKAFCICNGIIFNYFHWIVARMKRLPYI
jgi:hypothetical protein